MWVFIYIFQNLNYDIVYRKWRHCRTVGGILIITSQWIYFSKIIFSTYRWIFCGGSRNVYRDLFVIQNCWNTRKYLILRKMNLITDWYFFNILFSTCWWIFCLGTRRICRDLFAMKTFETQGNTKFEENIFITITW